MCLVVFGHGQNRNLRNRAFLADDAARAFIHGSQVGVQIARIAAAAGNFLAGGGNFTQGFAVVGDVRQNHQHMHSLFVRQIFCRCQCHFRRRDTFNRRVIRQIHEQHSALDSARPAEVADKVIRFLIGDADSAEHDGEAVALAQHARLTRNLRRQLCVRQTRAGEHRQLLTANQRVQTVNGGNARLDKFTRIVARGGIQRFAVDIHPHFGNQLRAAILWLAHAVENAAEHVHRDAQFNAAPQKTRRGVGDAQAVGGFKQLHHRLVAIHFQHFAGTNFAVRLMDFHQLIVCHAADAFHQHQRANDLFNRMVLFEHQPSPPSSISAAH